MVDDFDPRQMRRDGLKMVLQVKPNEVKKYMEDDESSTPMGRLGDRISRLDLGRAGPRPVSGRPADRSRSPPCPRPPARSSRFPSPAPLGEKLTRLQGLLAPQVPAARWTSTLALPHDPGVPGRCAEHRPEHGLQGRGRGRQPVSALRAPPRGRGSLPQPGEAASALGRADGTRALGRSQSCRKRSSRPWPDVGYRPDDQRFTPHVDPGTDQVRSPRPGRLPT